MILKTYEFLKKTKLTDSIYLLYGDNEGYQNEIQSKILEFKNKAKILYMTRKNFLKTTIRYYLNFIINLFLNLKK